MQVSFFCPTFISTVRRLANMACSTKIGTNLAQSEEMVLKPPPSTCFFIFYKLRQIRIFSRMCLIKKPKALQMQSFRFFVFQKTILILIKRPSLFTFPNCYNVFCFTCQACCLQTLPYTKRRYLCHSLEHMFAI